MGFRVEGLGVWGFRVEFFSFCFCLGLRGLIVEGFRGLGSIPRFSPPSWIAVCFFVVLLLGFGGSDNGGACWDEGFRLEAARGLRVVVSPTVTSNCTKP